LRDLVPAGCYGELLPAGAGYSCVPQGREAVPLFIKQGGKETMTTTATAVNTEVSVSHAEPKVNFARFRSTIRQYINGRITRERFLCDWRTEQQEQGIRATRRKVCEI